jgi:large subunit ribosomal protein L18
VKTIGRVRRHVRIARKMEGTALKPRMVVFRSKKHMYVQMVDDTGSKIVATCSTLSKDFKAKNIKSTNKEAAKQIGALIASMAAKLGIKEACFDRAGYKYHGRVKALADGAREGGLKF